MSKSSTTASASKKTTKPAAKRPKNHHHQNQNQNQELLQSKQHQSLLPGLPDHIAEICLSLVKPSTLYSVCRSWRRLIYSPSFPPFLSIYALLLPAGTPDGSHDYFCQNLPNFTVQFSYFDPISSAWLPLPRLPPDPPPPRFLLHHPSFISRRLPVQSVGASGKLVLVAATTDQFQPALDRPLVFDPLSQRWCYGPPLWTPRRWCAAGSSAGAIYVASGIGSHYSQDVGRSAERWDLRKAATSNSKRNPKESGSWRWEKMAALRDGRFSRDAVDALGWRGKLCMVNVKGNTAKEGIIYDAENDAWAEMPAGMLAGWRGPAAAMDEETIYVVNESKGTLRRYDPQRDCWVDVFESEKLRGAQYAAAGGGKVCVVRGNESGIVVVEVASQPCRVLVVDTPPGFQAISIHVLPRMSQQAGFESMLHEE